MDRAEIDRYAAGAEALSAWVEGLTPQELTAYPVPGTWSILDIVMHMMDSDLIASDRMKRVIAEEHPTVLGYDETAFTNTLGYTPDNAQTAIEVFRLNRDLTTGILRRQEDATFQRTCHHNEDGEKSLADFVSGYADHLEHHEKFVRQKRELLGKPLTGD